MLCITEKYKLSDFKEGVIMKKKISALITAFIMVSSCLCSCGSEETKNNAQDPTTTTTMTTEKSLSIPNNTDESKSDTELRTIKSKETTTTTTTTTTTAATTKAKPKTRPVPAIVKSIMVETNNSNGFDKQFMYYCKEYGFEGEANDEMWFQDIDGDGKPDLVLGGHSAVTPKTGQGRSNCYCLYLSSGQGSDYLEFKPDYAHKNKYGHDAFVLQAYKDKNGKLMFTQTQFHAYTSGEPRDPRYAGTFGLYEYDFKNGKSEKDKKELLFYSYDPSVGSFNCSDENHNGITAVQAKQFYNNYYSDKTPLKAKVKTIKYKDYLKMNQKQRKKALTDSYYDFSYTVDRSIKPYGKEVFDRL